VSEPKKRCCRDVAPGEGLLTTYGVALAQRPNVEKGQRLVALKELEAGYVACEGERMSEE